MKIRTEMRQSKDKEEPLEEERGEAPSMAAGSPDLRSSCGKNLKQKFSTQLWSCLWHI